MTATALSGVEADTQQLARRMAALEADEKSHVFSLSGWSQRLLDWAMDHPPFKAQLFRFVDAFPALGDDADVVDHLQQYFHEGDLPRLLDVGVGMAGRLPFGDKVSAATVRRNIARVAQQFILGATTEEAVVGASRLWEAGRATTVDLLGEKTIVAVDADRYAERVTEMLTALADAAARWRPQSRLDHDDLGERPRVNVSVKPSALATHFQPLTRAEGLRQAKDRLRPILRLAHERGAAVHVDMEHYDANEITLQLVRDLLAEDELADVDVGVVVQAYLLDSRNNLADLIAWSSARSKPITVRLVKGAYWDTETIAARAAGWYPPVFQAKPETDANYERCVRLLHDHHGEVRAAFATHNLRSLAYSVAYGRSCGIPDEGYEIQMLHGMAEPLHAAVVQLGLRLRVYAPVGELVPGMAYLVRRLLENTSNDSFVRLHFAEGAELDDLLTPPEPHIELPEPSDPWRVPPTNPRAPSPYAPEPVREWRRARVRADFAVAVEGAASQPRLDVAALIDGEPVRTADTIESVDPADTATVIATSASCTFAEADAAVEVARANAHRWQARPVVDRAAVLFRTAEWFRSRRDALAALEIFEAGKPWAEADADVCEAIDFCEYYGRQMLRLDGPDGAEWVQSPPGEANRLSYAGKGVVAVIAPWNFPLAIPTGMTVAALVAGNPVVLKPAEQTPAVASKLAEALFASGLPTGVLGFLPGRGEDVGARLVSHPDVSVIAFTGSRDVGLVINQLASATQPGQQHVKRVIAEMGGKNAIVVDADADPDQVVPAVVSSAFGYAGQKCSAASRLIVHERAYGAVVDRLVSAVAELTVGHPKHMGTELGPLIDADAVARLTDARRRADDEGTVLLAGENGPVGGCFVSPTVVADVDPGSRLATEELFGPLLTVFRAADLDHALMLANDTPYALTAACFSRSPASLQRAAVELRAGNVYLNRGTTGAVVGRQPFGGHGLSGVGSKAGGPEYLLQFLDPRTVSENTVRQGFAPT